MEYQEKFNAAMLAIENVIKNKINGTQHLFNLVQKNIAIKFKN